ncbi:MAG TPA: sugar transferase [Candidatus Nitrosotalea sp.]|nr:sugar transferase [Candidatus Nitrosotalea sp.]
MAQLQVDLDAPTYWPLGIAGSEQVRRAPAGFAYESGAKRVLDVVFASMLLVGTLPLWILIAIAIKLESPGPVIFRQVRVGRRGQPFRFYKFRSMRADAEQRRLALLQANEVSGPVFKMRSDPRITRVGRLLRRSSLDELPQLINVLRGEMSVVGPRPAIPEEVRRYRPSDAARLAVKPGLTCWWQVRGRSNCDFDSWMRYDREYIDDICLRTDLAIIWATFWAVITARGAY